MKRVTVHVLFCVLEVLHRSRSLVWDCICRSAIACLSHMQVSVRLRRVAYAAALEAASTDSVLVLNIVRFCCPSSAPSLRSV